MNGRHVSERPAEAKYWMIPQHCSCHLSHVVRLPFVMSEGKRWGHHTVKTTVIRRSPEGSHFDPKQWVGNWLQAWAKDQLGIDR